MNLEFGEKNKQNEKLQTQGNNSSKPAEGDGCCKIMIEHSVDIKWAFCGTNMLCIPSTVHELRNGIGKKLFKLK